MGDCTPDDAYEPEGAVRQYLEDEGFDTFGLVLGMRVLHVLCIRCGSNDGVERECRHPHDPTMACRACADEYHAFWDEEDESARESHL